MAQLLNVLQMTHAPLKSSNSSDESYCTKENSRDFDYNLCLFWHDVYILGIILVGSTFVGCFINHHVDQRQKRMGAKMRIACCSLIQRKVS